MGQKGLKNEFFLDFIGNKRYNEKNILFKNNMM